MKKVGWVLIALALLGVASALSMDTSVQVGTSIHRVNNLGLMSFQQNTLIASIGLLLVGAIFVAVGMRSLGSRTSDSNLDLRTCPHCAEKIQALAVVCRYCGRDVTPIEAQAPAKSNSFDNTKIRVDSVVRSSSNVASMAANTVAQQIAKSRIPFKAIGLSAIALLVVLSAIGWGIERASKHHAAEVDIDNLSDALKLYKFDNGQFPAADQGLMALVAMPTAEPIPSNWRHYIDHLPNDPWGRPYLYRNPGPSSYLEVISLGADGQLGGEGEAADIQKWLP